MRFKSSLIFILITYICCLFFCLSLYLFSCVFLLRMIVVSSSALDCTSLPFYTVRHQQKNCPCRFWRPTTNIFMIRVETSSQLPAAPEPNRNYYNATNNQEYNNPTQYNSYFSVYDDEAEDADLYRDGKCVCVRVLEWLTILGEWGFWHRLIRHKQKAAFSDMSRKNFRPLERNWKTHKKPINLPVELREIVRRATKKIKRNERNRLQILMNLEICSSRAKKNRSNKIKRKTTHTPMRCHILWLFWEKYLPSRK